MARPPRADEAGGIYHALNRGNLRATIFHKEEVQDDGHFLVVCRYVERNALRAGLVEAAEQWRWGSLWRWLQNPEPEPKLLSPWPIPRRAKLGGAGQ